MVFTSKLTRPTPAASCVDRPRLYRELERWQSVRAVIIRAAAGYGKSALVSRWIDVAGNAAQVAWLSLDESDSDPRQFVRYVAAALDAIMAGTLALVQPIIDDAQGDPRRALHTLLLDVQAHLREDPGASERHVLLVLDDVHVLQSSAVDSLIMLILERGPPQLHVCLLSRRSLPLPLARLYAQGQIHELTTDDLRFTADEVRQYCLQRGFAPVNESALSRILLRTEGWIASLQLATISQRERGHVGDLLKSLHGDSRWLAHYLTSEVLAQQTPAMRQFLLQTSILDAFNAPLCEAVTGVGGAYRMLAEIENADLFLIQLDGQREWFRYHHLFQELLQQRLHASAAPHTLDALHRCAAAWLANANRIPEAVRHLRAVGDDQAAVELVASRMHAGMLHDPYQARQWLDLLPQQLVVRHPRLTLDRCRLEILFDNHRLMPFLQQAELALAQAKLSSEEAAALHAELLVYCGIAHFLQADIAAAATYASQVRSHGLDDFLRGTLEFLRMHLCRYEGKHVNVQYHAARAMAAFARVDFVAGIISVRRELAQYTFRLGRSSEATYHFQSIFAEQDYGNSFAARELLYAYLHAAENSYWQNDLLQARAYQQNALALARRLQDDELLAVTTCLGEFYTFVDPQQRVIPRTPGVVPGSFVANPWYVDVQTRLLVMTGRYQEAWIVAEESGLDLNSEPADWSNRVLIPFLRAYIARGVDLHAVKPFLARTLIQRSAIGDRFCQVQLLALMAWHEVRMQCESAAVRTLVQAARLALETGYVRAILDIPELAPLLVRVDDPAISALAFLSTGTHHPAHINLTGQEQCVLNLLAADYKYQQIAEELVVSVNTVRTHVRHIYEKLGVNRRAQAIERARVAGLIRPYGERVVHSAFR